MKVLIVTNMYPTKETPFYGIFVAEQEKAIKKYYPDVQFGIYNIRGDVDKKEYLRSLNGVYKEIERGEYDLIHIHYGFSGLFLLNPFRKVKIPIVLTLHGGDILSEQGKKVQVFFTKRILKHADHVITLNKRMDDIASKYNKNTTIIPCSVDTDLFHPTYLRKSTIDKKEFTIVFPSAHTRYVKNYPLFVDVMHIMKEKYGIVCHERELDKMTREQVRDMYNDSDAMLMTSISEGSPQAVKEAMACNLPVVTTKVGDVDVLLEGVEHSGWVAPHDASLLAEKLHESLTGHIQGIKARDKIFQLGIDDESVAKRIYDIYYRLLNKQQCVSHK